jgi:2-keto-3-deoxy-L-rhamnonate aldolase RhmA
MAVNKLRERLKRPESSYGLWITMESPALTEIAAALGLDWVCIDMEHGHLDYGAVIEHLRAVRGSDTSVLVRVPEVQPAYVRRVLDMGAHGVFLPLVHTRAEVERGISFGRYPPQGERGVGGERAVHWGLGFQEYLDRANAETLIIPIIETVEAVENSADILAAPGLEAIFFGPSDLSTRYGYLGQWEAPGVAEKILAIRAQAAARGIAAGLMATSPEDAAMRRDQNFNLIGLGSDAGLLIRSINQAMEKLRGHTTTHLWF